MRLSLVALSLMLLSTPALAQDEDDSPESETQESKKPTAKKAVQKPTAKKAVEKPTAEKLVEPAAEEAAEAATAEAPAEAATAEAPAEAAPATAGARQPMTVAGREVGRIADGVVAEPMPTETRRDGENCVFDDLKGQFTLTLPCDLLVDNTGHSQPHKRIWLGAPEGQLNIIEVPDPYRTVEIDEIMGNLGRFWTARYTPEPARETTLGGLDARVVTERKIRTLTRHWVFNLDGRNVTLKIAAYSPKEKDREAWLAKVSEAVEAGLKFN